MKAFLTAGLALATCAAFAAIEKQTFDSMDVGPIPAGNAVWSGEGTVGTKTGTGVSGKSLVVAGTVICSNDTSAAAVSEFVKTSFDVKAPEDGTTELPTGDELTGCQIAIATGEATGTNNEQLKVMVYATTNANEAGWVDTTLTVATGGWFNVTLSFDYSGATKTAKVQIGNAVKGPFTLVNSPASTTAKINSLNFVGSTELDNVGIDEALAKIQLPSNLDGLMVYTNSLPSGVTLANLTDNGGDNNYAKHIEAGLTPSSEALDFNATGLSTVTEDNTVKTVITVPCNADYGQIYKVVITGANGEITGSPVTAEAGAISENSRALKFVVPETEEEEKVLKFTVQSGNGN